MLVVYVLVLIVLALLQVLLRWRVARLERRYVRSAGEAEALLKAVGYRPGNGKVDPLLSAKHQFDLARVAINRDRAEQRYSAWQTFSEKFTAFRRRLSGYQGKVLPYVVGAADVATGLLVLEQFGLSLSDVRGLLGM